MNKEYIYEGLITFSNKKTWINRNTKKQEVEKYDEIALVFKKEFPKYKEKRILLDNKDFIKSLYDFFVEFDNSTLKTIKKDVLNEIVREWDEENGYMYHRFITTVLLKQDLDNNIEIVFKFYYENDLDRITCTSTKKCFCSYEKFFEIIEDLQNFINHNKFIPN